MEMDPTTTPTQSHPENPDSQTPENETTAIVAPPLTTASISLSLSSILPTPTHFFTPTKITNLFTPKSVKIPPQISSALSTLSLSSLTLTPPKPFSKKSSFSASPLQNPLSLNPRLPSEPSNGAAVRRATVVWFRNDLRVLDNECLTTASNESSSVLPVYCFDPRDYGKSSSGFDKTGPYRASFLIESVADLRKSLQARGSDLVVRIGKPEEVLAKVAKAVGAEAVYAHREVSKQETKAEEKIENAMKEEGVEMKFFWGSTLYHLDDLPFNLEEMPTNYGGFRERVQGLKVRETIAALDQLKGLPSRGDVEPGEIPSLVALGVNPNATLAQDWEAGSGSCRGGQGRWGRGGVRPPGGVEAGDEGREKIESAMKEEGVEMKFFWGSTLYHLDDLPFNLEEMPTNYGGFRERVQGLKVRETIAALDQLKELPSRGDVEPGEIPFLVALGVNPNATLAQDGKPAANASLVGGETEALQRLQKFAAECKAQPPKSKDGTNSIYGANFSCKISPWLAMGCLSPRHMFDELKKTASRTISASNRKDGDDGMNWLMFELLWRDFFRFITAKYSSAKKQLDAAPATACTGALV